MSKQGYGILAAFLLIVGGLGAAIGWSLKPADIRALPVFNEAPQIKEVTKIERIKVPVKEVQVIEKTKLVKEVQLPEWVKKDENQQVIATGTVAPDRNRGDVEAVTTLNTQSGESTMLMRQKDRSLFGLPNEKEIGVGYGISTKGKMDVTVYGRWDVLRIGNVIVHAYGEANQSEAKAEIRAGYRF